MAEKKIIKNRKRNFVDDGLGWLVKVKEVTKACCSICHKTIELSTSGRSGLTDHTKGKKHTEVIDRRKNFFKPKSSTSTTADTFKSSKSAATTDLIFKKDNQCTLDNILSQTNSTNCEIIWILKCVMSGVSVRFNDDIRETFSAMFPENDLYVRYWDDRSQETYTEFQWMVRMLTRNFMKTSQKKIWRWKLPQTYRHWQLLPT